MKAWLKSLRKSRLGNYPNSLLIYVCVRKKPYLFPCLVYFVGLSWVLILVLNLFGFVFGIVRLKRGKKCDFLCKPNSLYLGEPETLFF